MTHPDGGVPSRMVDPEHLLAEEYQQVSDANYELSVILDDVFERPEWLHHGTRNAIREEYRQKATVVAPENGQISYRITNGDITYVTYGPGSRSSALIWHITGEDPDTYRLLVMWGTKEDMGAQAEYVTATCVVRSEADFLSTATLDKVLQCMDNSFTGPEEVELLGRGSLWASDVWKSLDDVAVQERIQRGLRHTQLATALLDELARPIRSRGLYEKLWGLIFVLQQRELLGITE